MSIRRAVKKEIMKRRPTMTVLSLFFSACAVADGSTHVEPPPEALDMQTQLLDSCAGNADNYDALEAACCMARQPVQRVVDSATLGSPTPPTIEADTVAYRVRGPGEGVVQFSPKRTGMHYLHFSMSGSSFRVIDPSGADVPWCWTHRIQQCGGPTFLSTLIRRSGYWLESGKTYRLESRRVASAYGLYIQTGVEPTLFCGIETVAPSWDDACSSSAPSVVLRAGPVSSAMAPAIAIGGHYGVKLLQAGSSTRPEWSGAFSLTAPASGTYEVYFGAPDFSLSLEGETGLIQGKTHRMSDACGRYRRLDTFALEEGRTYRFVVASTRGVPVVNVAIRSADGSQLP